MRPNITSFQNEIDCLQQEFAVLFKKVLIEEENLKKVDQNYRDQLYEINEKNY